MSVQTPSPKLGVEAGASFGAPESAFRNVGGWKENPEKQLGSEHVTRLNSDASVTRCYQRTPTTMVGRHATPEADITITHHLPPPEDDSTQDVSMSFVIPPQADASNLLDQDCDDFFSGPGLVTLSTPVLPRHLTNTRHSVRKVAGSIQTPAVVPSTILGQNLPVHSSTELEPSVDKAELQETHIPPRPSPLLSPPTEPFTYTDPPTTASVVGTTSITGPGLSRPSDTLSESGRDAKICDGLKSLTALSMASVLTTKATGTQPGIQSTSTSAPSRHSANAQNTQIPRQPPIPAPQKKNKGPAQSRRTVIAKSDQAASKHRSGNFLYRETTSVSCARLCHLSWDMRISG